MNGLWSWSLGGLLLLLSVVNVVYFLPQMPPCWQTATLTWTVGDDASATVPYVGVCLALEFSSNRRLFYFVSGLSTTSPLIFPSSTCWLEPTKERRDTCTWCPKSCATFCSITARKWRQAHMRTHVHTHSQSEGPSSAPAVIERGVQADGDSRPSMISSLSVLQ